MKHSLPAALILTATLACGSMVAFAGEPLPRHPACTDPQFDYSRLDAQTLREIAYRCDSPAAVRLYLNRANYRDLWDSWGYLVEIEGTGEVSQQLMAYRVFVILIEDFARQMPHTSPSWMVTLNQGYENGPGFSDSALRGYSSQSAH